jgi:hypothetical protein
MYEALLTQAGIGGIAQGMGRHLRKIADWCAMRDMPMLDSLVVRGLPWQSRQRVL